MARKRPALGVEIAQALALITLLLVVLNAGLLWLLYEQQTVARHQDLTIATARTLRAQLESFRGDGQGSWKRMLQTYRKADLRVEELWVVDGSHNLVGKAVGAPPDLPDAGLREALYGRAEHYEMVGRFTGRPVVVVTEPLVIGGAVAGALRVAMRWEGGAFLGGRVGFLLFYTLVSGTAVALFGYTLFRRRLLQPILEIQRATRRIAGGEFGHIVDVEAARELEAVSEALTQMSVSLADYQVRTAEQVASLEAANAELRQAREELIRSEKLASVGRLAAGLAHELGNPLAAVLGYTELLASRLDDPDLEADLLARSGRQLERIQRIIRDLLDFARPGVGTPTITTAEAMIDEAVGTVAHLPSFREIALTAEVEPGLPAMMVEAEKVHQVLINLLINAGDALGGGGAVRVRALRAGDFVEIDVRDDGPGFAPADLPKVFDPFFTTKEPGHGTGLGLAICQRIADGLGGGIRASNSEEGGAVMTLSIPVPL